MTEHDWFAAETPEPLMEYLRSQPPSERSSRAVFLYASACYRLNWDAHDPAIRTLVEMLEAKCKTRSEPVAVKSFLNPITRLFSGDFTGAVGQIFALSSAGAWAMAQMATDATRTLGADPRIQADFLREFCPPPSAEPIDDSHSLWLSESVQTLTLQIDETSNYQPMPILADCLEEAGCRHLAMLEHCRQPNQHRLGCWVIDSLIGMMQE